MNSAAKASSDSEVFREVVGIFFDSEYLQQAIERLKDAGFSSSQLGLLAHSEAVSSKLGHLYDQVAEDPEGCDSPECKFVEKRPAKTSANAFLGGLGLVASAAASGAIVASAAILAGPIGAATAGAAVVGGVGALASTIISESDSQRLQSYLEEGHLLLFVRTASRSEETTAKEIVNELAGLDSEVVEFRNQPTLKPSDS